MSDQNQTEAPRQPSKMQERLRELHAAAKVLKGDNDPSIDPSVQNAMRTQALANVVASIIECVENGLGATGMMVSELNKNVVALAGSVQQMEAAVAQVHVRGAQAPAEAGESETTSGADGTPQVPNDLLGAPPEIAAMMPGGSNGSIVSSVQITK